MQRERNVAIFWDYENCHAPSSVSGYELVNSIRSLAYNYGTVKLFKAYLAVPDQSSLRATTLRSELQSSGVSLTDCPHNGKKNVSDLMMVVDMMALAIDNPAPWTIFLITGDGDFSYAASILRLRQYDIALICPTASHTGLKSQASICFDWNADVMSKVVTSANSPPLLPSCVIDPARVVDSPSSGSLGVSNATFGPSTQPGSLAVTARAPTSVQPCSADSLVSPPAPATQPSVLTPQQSVGGAATTGTSNGWLLPSLSTIRAQMTSGTGNTGNSSPPQQNSTPDPPPVYSQPPVVVPVRPASGPPDSPKQRQGPTFGALAAASSSNTRPTIQQQFLPLAQILDTYRKRGILSPLRSVIGTELSKNPKIYESFPGNSKPFRPYCEAAKNAGVVCMGGLGGDAWISLHPNWYGKVP